MRPARRAALLVPLAWQLLPGCAGERVYECAADAECVLGGATGRCEPSGYCSLPDADCPDGYRYVEQAPDSLAGTCVGAAGCEEEPCDDGCAVAIAAGARHSCAADQQGGVHCWGDNGDLQLGASGEGGAAPRLAAGVSGAVAVSAGDRHTCAILVENGEVVCWGGNDRGQLGIGTTGASALPGEKVGDSQGAGDLSAGAQHVCAIDDNCDVWCWGDNAAGQVSSDVGATAAYPDDPLGIIDCAERVAAGGRHSAAVLDDGQIVTWGEDDAPALGRGTPTPGDPYSIVVDAFEAVSITAGEAHTCGIGDDRAVRCWGVASDGRLGVTGGDRDRPVDVPGLHADLVRAGSRHTCALDGSDLFCWGANDEGQLGAEGASGPDLRQVPGSWLAVATGSDHTCALASDRTVHCWGRNDDGQVGRDGSASSEPSLVPLACP